MNASLDGYIVGPDGGFDWSAPDEELFEQALDEVRDLGVHLMGRRLYETMLYWEAADQQPDQTDLEREWMATWNPLPKIVFSRTLAEVQGAARLAAGDVVSEIARLREESDEGEIGIGGATLAAQVADAGLIDEYRIRVHPVLVGGGISYFSHASNRVDLELIDTRSFPTGVVASRYRVVR